MPETTAPRKIVEPEIVEEAPDLPMTANPNLPATLRNRILSQMVVKDPIEAFNSQIALMAVLTPASISKTKPQDWVQMGGGVYLQATGAERITPLYGMVFGTKTVEELKHSDGTFSYLVSMPVYSRTTGVYYDSIEGGRWSGEAFFKQTDDAGDPVPVNPMDVRKAAVTNCEIRAMSKISGLRNLTPADIEGCGVKPATKVAFRSGGKGGAQAQAQVDKDGEPVIPFGKNAGKKLSELTDKSLDWYATKAKDNLDSDAYKQGGDKFRFRAKEEKFHGYLMDEVNRRVEELRNPDDPER